MKFKTCNVCYIKFKGKNKTCNNCIISARQSSSYSTCEEWVESCTVAKRDNTPNDLIKGLIGFKNKKLIDKKQTINFAHPFTCKLLGCRGSGKTTFIINYLNTGVLNLYDDIFWISTSDRQELLSLLNDRDKIIFCDPTLGNIKSIYKNLSQYVKTLLIFDDCMYIQNNEIVLDLRTNLNVSIISLEQQCNVERGNTDYFLLFKLNDMEGLDRFRKKFCSEYNFNDFCQIYNHCINLDTPLFISFNSYTKFRSNFNTEIKLINNMIEEIPIITVIEDEDLKIIPKKKKKAFKNI